MGAVRENQASAHSSEKMGTGICLARQHPTAVSTANTSDFSGNTVLWDFDSVRRCSATGVHSLFSPHLACRTRDAMTDHPNRIANLLNVTSTPMAGWLRYRLFEPPGARASVPRLWVSLRARRPLWDPLATVLVAGRCDRRRVGPA